MLEMHEAGELEPMLQKTANEETPETEPAS